MKYKTYRNFSIGVKVIAILMILYGSISYGGSIGAGIYNHDNDQIGEGIQFLTITIGLGIAFLIVGSIIDKQADDIKHHQLMESIKKGK